MKAAAAYLGLATAAVSLPVTAAYACSIIPISEEERLRQAYDRRAKSAPVDTHEDCSFENAGAYDNYSGGPAVALGNARFYQAMEHVDGRITAALVTDCNTREVIRFDAAVIDNENRMENSCGGFDGDFYTLIGADGVFDPTQGKDVSALARIAERMPEVSVDKELRAMHLVDAGVPLSPKDKVDFLCGCRLLYPETAGARP